MIAKVSMEPLIRPLQVSLKFTQVSKRNRILEIKKILFPFLVLPRLKKGNQEPLKFIIEVGYS
jgi:hypothetical protein